MKTIKLTISKIALITLLATNNAYAAQINTSAIQDKLTQVQTQVCKELGNALQSSTQKIINSIQVKADLQLLKNNPQNK